MEGMAKEGQKGQGDTGFSKYDPANAPVTPNGGNTEIQDGVRTEKSPESYYGGGMGSLQKAKGE